VPPPPPEREPEEEPPDEEPPDECDEPEEPDDGEELLPPEGRDELLPPDGCEEPLLPDDGRLIVPEPPPPRGDVEPELPPRPLLPDELDPLGDSRAPPIDPITRRTVSPVPPRHESVETTPRDWVALVELPEVEGLLTGSRVPPRITVRGLEEVVPPDEVEAAVVEPWFVTPVPNRIPLTRQSPLPELEAFPPPGRSTVASVLLSLPPRGLVSAGVSCVS